MKTCKCEHWQQCPVCMPHRFDADGKILPPEPTPLQAAQLRIKELEQQLAERENQTKDQCAALCYQQNWLIHGEEMSALILATKEVPE